MSTHTTEIVHQPTIGCTDLSTDSFKKCLEFGWQGDIVYKNIMGGFCLGGFCPGGFCPRGDFVQGDFVLEPLYKGGKISNEAAGAVFFVWQERT